MFARVVRWAARHFDMLKAVVPALVALILLSIVGLAIRGAQVTTNSKQSELIVAGCKRQNARQVEDNVSSLADFRYFMAHGGKAAANAQTWTPPIPDCARVGAHYRQPPPIPFNRRLPPASALTAH